MLMNSDTPRLPHLRLSQPCAKNWDDLQGTGPSRYCDHCQLHVHNLSAMTEEQAEAFLRSDGGRKCVYFLRRTDGSVLTAGPARLAAGLLLAGAAMTAACKEEPREPRRLSAEQEQIIAELGYCSEPAPPQNRSLEGIGYVGGD